MAFIKNLPSKAKNKLKNATVITPELLDWAKDEAEVYEVEWQVKNGLVVPVAVKEGEAKKARSLANANKKAAKEPAAMKPARRRTTGKGDKNVLRGLVLEFLDANRGVAKAEVIAEAAAMFNITKANARYYYDRVWAVDDTRA